MCYRDELLSNPNNSFLGYIGAAIFGLTLNIIVNLIIVGNIFAAGAIYLIYMVVVVFIDSLCGDSVNSACRINEFWISLEGYIKAKIGFTNNTH